MTSDFDSSISRVCTLFVGLKHSNASFTIADVISTALRTPYSATSGHTPRCLLLHITDIVTSCASRDSWPTTDKAKEKCKKCPFFRAVVNHWDVFLNIILQVTTVLWPQMSLCNEVCSDVFLVVSRVNLNEQNTLTRHIFSCLHACLTVSHVTLAQSVVRVIPSMCEQNTFTRHIFSHLSALMIMSHVTFPDFSCVLLIVEHPVCIRQIVDLLHLQTRSSQESY